jgi:hypothetical protein
MYKLCVALMLGIALLSGCSEKQTTAPEPTSAETKAVNPLIGYMRDLMPKFLVEKVIATERGLKGTLYTQLPNLDKVTYEAVSAGSGKFNVVLSHAGQKWGGSYVANGDFTFWLNSPSNVLYTFAADSSISNEAFSTEHLALYATWQIADLSASIGDEGTVGPVILAINWPWRDHVSGTCRQGTDRCNRKIEHAAGDCHGTANCQGDDGVCRFSYNRSDC